MIVKSLPINPLLLEYIERIMIVHVNFALESSLSPIYRSQPNHSRLLCFSLGDRLKVVNASGEKEIRPESLLIGPHLNHTTLDLGRMHSCVFVSLKPSGMYRLVGVPIHEVLNKCIDASLVLGKEIKELIECLLNAKNDEEIHAHVQKYLLEKLRSLRPAIPFDRAILELTRASGNLSIDYIAAQSCLSQRQFQRKSLERIGIAPKLYARLVRFSHAYKYKETFPESPWVKIAHRFDYFDHMHFIRDFKAFSGVAPGISNEMDNKTSVKFYQLME